MSTHKDLPPGSQRWASDLDAAMQQIKELTEVVRRLTENAGIDMANPKRGINRGNTPSVKSPVGQKLSSLADVGSYNVLEGQVLTWSQKGQKWLPATPVSAGGAVEIPMSYSSVWEAPTYGYGNLDHVAESQWGYFGTTYRYGRVVSELWSTDTVYIGGGNFDTGPVALIEVTDDGLGRPYVQISAEDYADSTYGVFTVGSYFIRMDVPYFVNPRVDTASRPDHLGDYASDVGSQTYDYTLRQPIWWNGTTWTNALGTAV